MRGDDNKRLVRSQQVCQSQPTGRHPRRSRHGKDQRRPMPIRVEPERDSFCPNCFVRTAYVPIDGLWKLLTELKPVWVRPSFRPAQRACSQLGVNLRPSRKSHRRGRSAQFSDRRSQIAVSCTRPTRRNTIVLNGLRCRGPAFCCRRTLQRFGEPSSQNLAGRALGQLITDHDPSWNFERSDLVLQIAAKLGRSDHQTGT